MDKKLIILFVITGALAAFIGYFVAVTDWIQDYSNGIYSHNPAEALLETSALLIYTYFGIRFFNRHIGSLR